MISPEQQTKLNELASRYTREIFNDVDNALKRHDRTGRTRASLKVSWIRANASQPPRIIVEYDQQAAVFETSRPSWVKVPNVEKLLDWSEAVTFTGPVPGYKNGVAPNLPPWKIKQRIVAAIAIDKRKNDSWKRKPWRKVALSDVLKNLNRDTIASYNSEVENVLNKALETGET